MSRDHNKIAEMEVFVRVIQDSGFSPAARTLHLTPSAVSKLIGRLEARLGVRLFNRSTRKLELTEEGTRFHQRALGILSDLDEAEREVASVSAPRGLVRVSSNVPFGLHYFLPLVPTFLARYPSVTLDIQLGDRVIDLYEERVDVAIRVGPLRPSQLVSRKLGESRMALVAAPEYLELRGTPENPKDLAKHNCINFGFARHLDGWPVRARRGVRVLQVQGNALAGDGETNRQLALGGVGISRLALFHIGPDLAERRLVRVLERFNPGDAEAIHAVYVGQGGHLPSRVRVLLDFLADHVKLTHA
jgi:DNA-binding transcriptional LysR family regulator